MVFPHYFYCPRTLYGGASGVTFDLVATSNVAGMEDRAHHRYPRNYLDFVPALSAIVAGNPGVLPAHREPVKAFCSVLLRELAGSMSDRGILISNLPWKEYDAPR